MPKAVDRNALLRKILKRIDRMQKDAALLNKELGQIDDFYYTAEDLMARTKRISEDTWRLMHDEQI